MIEDHVMRRFIFRDRSTNDRTAVKSVIQWVQRNNRPPQLGELILVGRKYKRLTLYLSIACSILVGTLYLTLIHPVFLPSDLANPAVVNFIASDSFQEMTRPIFLKLDK